MIVLFSKLRALLGEATAFPLVSGCELLIDDEFCLLLFKLDELSIELLLDGLANKLVLRLEDCPIELVVVVVFSACVELVCVDG